MQCLYVITVMVYNCIVSYMIAKVSFLIKHARISVCVVICFLFYFSCRAAATSILLCRMSFCWGNVYGSHAHSNRHICQRPRNESLFPPPPPPEYTKTFLGLKEYQRREKGGGGATGMKTIEKLSSNTSTIEDNCKVGGY